MRYNELAEIGTVMVTHWYRTTIRTYWAGEVNISFSAIDWQVRACVSKGHRNLPLEQVWGSVWNPRSLKSGATPSVFWRGFYFEIPEFLFLCSVHVNSQKTQQSSHSRDDWVTQNPAPRTSWEDPILWRDSNPTTSLSSQIMMVISKGCKKVDLGIVFYE